MPPSEVGKTKVDLRSVAIKTDGTIVVGDIKRKVLTEHSPTGGELRSTVPVKIAPHFLAVDIDDRVVVSDYTSKTVAVVDSNGAELFTVKPLINDRPVKYCFGVCADWSGIYVAAVNDDNAGHIHHYDTRGRFLKCIAQGLHWPLGLTFASDGQLAVAGRYSVKIYHEV